MNCSLLRDVFVHGLTLNVDRVFRAANVRDQRDLVWVNAVLKGLRRHHVIEQEDVAMSY
jgi:hypothetical protein